MSTRTRLRQLRDPLVVPLPSGVRTRTRIRPTAGEAAALVLIGEHLGGAYRQCLSSRLALGRANTEGVKEWRATQKRHITTLSSSRWAGAITRTVLDQYGLGMRGVATEVQSLTQAVRVLDARLAVEPGQRVGKVKGYPTRGEWFQKSRRRANRAQRLERAQARWEAGRPSITCGGGRLWRTREHLTDAGLSPQEWRAGGVTWSV